MSERKVGPAFWLRLRPYKPDTPQEYLRDFQDWAKKVIEQDGFSWKEFEYFAIRAQELAAKETVEGRG